MWSNQPEIRVFSGICPDEACKTKLVFPSYAASSIECTGCGKHFSKDVLNSVELIQDPEEAMRSLLRSVLLTRTALKKGTDLVKVKGYSNYHCRILSPILTYHGMEKSSSQAKLLRDMGQGEFFDCAHVGDRSFSIEPDYLDTPGYGRDKSGSLNYLHGLLEEVKLVNDNEDRLVPLHVDGDGYCLVHAISRALIGREIFWHALMVNLQKHLRDNLSKYKTLFVDFISRDEWDLIISEADPDFQPHDDQPLGLRNIHIFGLANVLHRPILLLDSVSGIQSSADYTGTFLPALVPVHLCKTKDGKCIPPLAIAWSNSGRNHYIPLVNLRGKSPAKLPGWVIPKAWGIPNELIKAYIEFEATDVCVIGGTKGMSDAYLSRLLKAMDDKFLEINKISASLVTEVHQFIFKPSGLVGVRPKTVIERTRQTVELELLMRCLSCNAVSEYTCPVNQEWLSPGGRMYISASHAAQAQGGLAVGEMYSFSEHNIVCTYNVDKDVLEVAKYKGVEVSECVLCKGSLRKVKPDGSPIYQNGDRTTTPVTGSSRCTCGYKHFWDGQEYDNQPELLPVNLDWGGTAIKEKVHWFQYESDTSLNSNVYAVAGKLVQKYFPGEFGSERLVQKVVDTILRQTARKEGENKGARPDIPNLGAAPSTSEDPMLYCPSKIILTGQKKKTFHKEELTQSDAERRVKVKTEHHAPLTQNRQSRLQKTPEKSPVKTQAPKQEPSPSSSRPSSSHSPRNNKRIRLSSSTGGQHDLTLPLNVTYSQLQEAIEKELGVLPRDQKIRFGFPPRVLHPPEEGKEQEPIPVQHGERVMVEVLPPPEPEAPSKEMKDITEEKRMDVAGAVGGESKLGVEETSKDTKTEASPMDVDADTAALASALMTALSGALPSDMWEMACRTPQMFDHGGYYYNLAFNSLGALKDEQHCTLPNLPNKVFAYNKEKDRLDLCLGKIHVPVQPINQENLALAHGQRTAHSSQSMVMNTEASFSGAITHRTSSHSTMAFTGEGRSLADSSTMAFAGEGRSMVDSSTPSHIHQEQQVSPSSNQPQSMDTDTSTAKSTTISQSLQQDAQSAETTTVTAEDSSMNQPSEKIGSPVQTEIAGEVAKAAAMETNEDSEQNSLSKKESDVSPQISDTADTDMKVVTMETTEEKQQSTLSVGMSPLTSGTADVINAVEVTMHLPENLDSMEIETGMTRGESRDPGVQVSIKDTNTNITETPRENAQEIQTGIPRDECWVVGDQVSTNTDVSVSNNPGEDNERGIARDKGPVPVTEVTAATEAKEAATGNPTSNIQEPHGNEANKDSTVTKETEQSVAIATPDTVQLLRDESDAS